MNGWLTRTACDSKDSSFQCVPPYFPYWLTDWLTVLHSIFHPTHTHTTTLVGHRQIFSPVFSTTTIHPGTKKTSDDDDALYILRVTLGTFVADGRDGNILTCPQRKRGSFHVRNSLRLWFFGAEKKCFNISRFFRTHFRGINFTMTSAELMVKSSDGGNSLMLFATWTTSQAATARLGGKAIRAGWWYYCCAFTRWHFTF